MRRSAPTALVFLLLLSLRPGFADISSLSQVFQPGKGLKDTDGDGWPDRIALQIVVPDQPSAVEMALAAEIAARANLESLAVDFALVKRESELSKAPGLDSLVLIGSNLSAVKEILKESRTPAAGLTPTQGLVFVFSAKNRRKGVAIVGGSEDALLRTGRAFFLRWPYFWDVWGREDGPTFFSLERDLERFLDDEGVHLQRTLITSALYDFPLGEVAGDLGRTFDFETGGIKRLGVEIHFADDGDRDKAFKALDLLRSQRARGVRTGLLCYPGCAAIAFDLRYGSKTQSLELPRLGLPRRMLTPAFKDAPRRAPQGKDFDLLSLLTTRGVYGDVDQDAVPDDVEASIVVPAAPALRSLPQLASRLVLDTAGASFPLVRFDREVERPAALAAPLLVGLNALSQELLRTGKLKLPPLESGQASVQVVPKAFGESNALAVVGADDASLEKALTYLGRTFPYLIEYGVGAPGLADVAAELEKFLKGDDGAAEAFLDRALSKAVSDLRGKDLESVRAEFILPRANPAFADAVKKSLAASLKAGSIQVDASGLDEGVIIFNTEKEFVWEADTALKILSDSLAALPADDRSPLRISLGLSESAAVRQKIKKRVEDLVQRPGGPDAEVEVDSAYKQGFGWLTEKVLPALKGKPVDRLVVQWAPETDDYGRPKRFYAEPSRWLQELYPADEIIARDLGLPLDRIEFEQAAAGGPTYRTVAFDDKGAVLFEQTFSPRIKVIPFLAVRPDWGDVRITTGWVRVQKGGRVITDVPLATDLESFWEFYQAEVLPAVYAHVFKATGGDPTFSKEPYFKKLEVELWLSEPDERIGLDEERISSLEALHDEIYFDTLDLLRGITRFDPDDRDLPEDASRASAPGGILPLIHPSLEGGPGRVRVRFEDRPAAAPRLVLRWKEPGREEIARTFPWPDLKVKPGPLLSLVLDGRENRVENLTAVLDCEAESDYLAFLDALQSYRDLLERGLLARSLGVPGLRTLTLRLRTKDLEKDEVLPGLGPAPERRTAPEPVGAGPIVPVDRILSYEKTRDIVDRLGRLKGIKAYSGGRSYEGRDIPVLEITMPCDAYASVPRLITFKPTLQITARQHANEVSSTNYSLRLAELLARDKAYQDFPKRMNVVIEPMENPDGADLAFSLLALTPEHSLHAGRYGALGVEVGSTAGAVRAVAPEAAVRRQLNQTWLPDIFLNLHGYPSHEWVQPFSGYDPYLFRDYWIPRGWYAFFRALRLSVYRPWKEAGEDLKRFIVEEMQADERVRKINRKAYERYERWAARWQPALADLELDEGLVLYARRRSSLETRLTARTRTTFAEETPEVMDETARGDWLAVLCEEGLAYLRAHLKYLAQAQYEVGRIEEEVQHRVRIQFVRSRPGSPARAARKERP
jgi:hypothetical protein